MTTVAAAYDTTGGAWQRGPGRVYDHLADVLVDRCPISLGGTRVVDVGAGTGAATRAATRRGATVIAVDVAPGMLAAGATTRPPAIVGDATRLPLRDRGFDAALALFSLNHLDDPVAGLRELARIVRPGGGVVATAYADDDRHPVKHVVDEAAALVGWAHEPWYLALRRDVIPRLATVDRAIEVARLAGLPDATVEHVAVEVPDLSPVDLVEWRLGMAQMAPFVARLSPGDRTKVVADAVARLGPAPPPLTRSTIVLTLVRA